MSKNTPNIPSKNISNHLFSIVFVFYGGSFLSNMSGRKHLRCSLGLLAPPAQTIWQNSGTEITPKLGHFWVKAVCLFVFLLTLTNPDHLSELWQAAKIESLSSDHTLHFFFSIISKIKKWKQILFLVWLNAVKMVISAEHNLLSLLFDCLTVWLVQTILPHLTICQHCLHNPTNLTSFTSELIFVATAETSSTFLASIRIITDQHEHHADLILTETTSPSTIVIININIIVII